MIFFCCSGSELFKSLVTEKIKNTFLVKSKDSKKFKYLGLDIEQHSEKNSCQPGQICTRSKDCPYTLDFWKWKNESNREDNYETRKWQIELNCYTDET